MIQRGECLCCKKISLCSATSVSRAKSGFTCVLFEGVEEAEWLARWAAVQQYGSDQTIDALIDQEPEVNEQEEENEDGREPEV